MPEGGRTGRDTLGSEVSAEEGGALHGGRRVAVPGARDACRREERPSGHPGVLSGLPGPRWPRTRRGRGPPAAYGRAAAKTQREMEVGTYLQILNSQGPLGKLKFSLFFGAQIKEVLNTKLV